MADQRPDERPLTLPHLIRRRRLARLRRRATSYAALLGALVAGLGVAGFAVGDDTAVIPPACTDTTTTVVEPVTTTTDPCPTATTDTTTTTTTDTTTTTTTTDTTPAPPTTTTDTTPTPTTTTTTDPAPPATTTEAAPPTTTTTDATPPAAIPVDAPTPAPDATVVPVAPVAPSAPSPRRPAAQHHRPKPAPTGPRWPDAGTSTLPTTIVAARETPAPAVSGASADGGGATPGSDQAAAPSGDPSATIGPAPAPSAQAVAFASIAGLSLPPLATGAATSFPGPDVLLPIYQAAAAEYHVPWTVLAAINEVETGFGKNVAVSSAGAVGWMQFMPSTWAQYGIDADGDHVADPNDPVDAIFSAARYLKAAGGDSDVPRSVFAYNHAGWYVDKVLGLAAGFQNIDPQVLTALTYRGMDAARSLHTAGGGFLAPDTKIDSLGRAMLLDDAALGEQAIKDADIYACGQQDIRAGRIDRRVLVLIEALSKEGLRPTITSLECGHSFLTASGNQSEHTTGTAVDIAAVNGIPILGHQGPGTITETVLRHILALPGFLTAHQVISLMTIAGFPNTMILADHYNHVHVGFHALAQR